MKYIMLNIIYLTILINSVSRGEDNKTEKDNIISELIKVKKMEINLEEEWNRFCKILNNIYMNKHSFAL